MKPDFGALFAFCDLHATRVRGALLLDSEMVGPGPQYYDRQGFPIPARDGVEPTLVWARLREQPDYPIVAVDDLPDGGFLSTVWLGLDHGFGGRPLIFETMRFAAETVPVKLPSGHIVKARRELAFPDPFGEPGDTTTQLRYTTEEEALAAHHEIVRRIVLREGH